MEAVYKILLLGQDWLQKELQARGHEVISASITNTRCDLFLRNPGLSISELLSQLPNKFIPERIIYWDDSTVPWITGLEEVEIPKLFFAVDTHQHNHWHPQFSAIFDKTLVAHKDYLDLFVPFAVDPEWMPLWATCEPMSAALHRDLNVVFVGTVDPILHPERAQFFSAINLKVPLTILSGNYLEPYSRAKIVLNHVVKGDLNFRVFEALSSGALLVTPRIKNGLSELFKDGQDLVCYENGNINDAIDKLQYYLSNDQKREQIAAEGNIKALTLHQSHNRVDKILLELERLEKVNLSERNYGAAYAYLAGFITCYNQKISWGNKLFDKGLELLKGLSYLQGKEKSATGIIYSHYLKELHGASRSIELLQQLILNSPNNKAFKLALVRELIFSNLNKAALKEAAKFSDSPVRVCEGVGEMLARELA